MDTLYHAIVLRSIKYSETSLIVKVYTYQAGLRSFMIKGVRSKSKKNLMGLFQPLSAVEIISSKAKSGSTLTHIKEIKSRYPFKDLHSNPYKIGVVFFIAEILDKTLKEEESNPLLFDFLDKSIHFFDELVKFSNFHIYFLLELSKYLGFYPLLKDENPNSFDLESGILQKSFMTNSQGFSESIISLFSQILGTKFVDRWEIDLSLKQRNELLNMLIDYYSVHVQGIDKLKSLEVLKNLYHN